MVLSWSQQHAVPVQTAVRERDEFAREGRCRFDGSVLTPSDDLRFVREVDRAFLWPFRSFCAQPPQVAMSLSLNSELLSADFIKQLRLMGG